MKELDEARARADAEAKAYRRKKEEAKRRLEVTEDYGPVYVSVYGRAEFGAGDSVPKADCIFWR